MTSNGAPIPVDSTMQPIAYAWPGGYPVFYLTEQNNVLCPKCAGRANDNEDDPTVAYDANWEDDSMYCDQCGGRIESAYNEPDDDSGNDSDDDSDDS